MHFINQNGNIIAASALQPLKETHEEIGSVRFLETILTTDGHLYLWQLHFERLQKGFLLAEMNINDCYTADFLEKEILKTIKANNSQHYCRVRLQVFIERKNRAMFYVIECFEIEKQLTQWNEKGWKVGIDTINRKPLNSFSNQKMGSRTLYEKATQLALTNHWDDALLLNLYNHIIESIIANIFWIAQGKIFTPPLTDGCVAGVMRQFLITQWAAKNITVEEKILTMETLSEADEVFLTNAIRRIKWIAEIAEKSYHNNITKSLYRLAFDEDK